MDEHRHGASHDAHGHGHGHAHDELDVDVLAGWDPAGPPAPLDGRPPFPTDTAVALAAMTVGALVGWLSGPPHRLRRMAAGKLLGLAGAIAWRRMWRLPEEPARRG